MVRRLTKEEFIEKSKKKHGDRYLYDKLVYISMLVEIILICVLHGEFTIIAGAHLSRKKGGCEECEKEDKPIRTKEDFIEKAIRIHGNRFDYSKVNYTKSTTKVEIKCNKHNKVFYQTTNCHLALRDGCDECLYEKKKENERIKGQAKFLEESKKKFGDKFDYSEVIYITSHSNKVKIGCPNHGKIMMTPHNHLQSVHGCEDCGVAAGHDKQRKTKEEFIQEAIAIHGDKYDYSEVIYITNKDPVKIICKVDGRHEPFYQSPNSHLSKRNGCPGCHNDVNLKREPLCRRILEEETGKNFPKLRPLFLYNKTTGRCLELDGFNEELKVGFEHQGRQHDKFTPYFHTSIEDFKYSQWKDEFKKEKCKENGINLIIIPYNIPETELKKYILDRLYPNRPKIRSIKQ